MSEIQQGGSIVQMIERVAVDPNVDIEKLERLLDMQERILDRQAAQAFSADMVAAQAEMPDVPKKAYNSQTNSRFAKLEHIAQAIRPVYTKHGFSILFGEGDSPKPDHLRIVADVMHRDGHSKTYHADVPIDIAGIKGNANKTATHATGSTLSYGRRYLTCMVFNVSLDDDDGNSASANRIQTITQAQAEKLNQFIDDHEMDREKIGVWLKTKGIESVDELPSDVFDRFYAMLKKGAQRENS